jgi:LysR family transcriptional regulator for bpeEF and oprC
LERHGEPDFPEALANHACIANISSVTGRPKLWVFHDRGADKELMISGPLTFRNVEAAVQAAVMGLGIAQTVSLAVDELVKKGLLKEILPGWSALGPLVQLLYPKSLVPNLMLQSFIEFSLESIPKYLIPSAGSSASPQEKGGSTDGVHTDP